MTKSNYDKLYQVLRAWYTPDQIDRIWDMLKIFDEARQDIGEEIKGISHKLQAASATKKTQLKGKIKI